ncbi:trichohyalin-like isoform X2 [Oscarella lobularis]|uniref:trichohyalin-like isoform X2 n=1 Tax=Oscarella lobularis TaxID=121494 RepID=UPI0033140F63
MASSSPDYNYDDDNFDEDFEKELENLDQPGNRQWNGAHDDNDDDDDTDDFIDSIREQLGPGGAVAVADDDSLALDLDEYLKDIEKSCDDSRASANGDDNNQDSLSQKFLANLSPSKDIDLAAYGVLTDEDDFPLEDVDLDLNTLEMDANVDGERKTSVGVGDLKQDLGSEAASEVSRFRSLHRFTATRDKEVSLTSSSFDERQSFKKSEHNGLHNESSLSQVNESANDEWLSEKLADEAALAQAALEETLSGNKTKTPSPSQRSQRSGRQSGSSSELSVAEKRWSFTPVLCELENGKNKSPLGGILNESLGRQVEESEQQLKRTVEGIQGATSELVDITQKKEVAQKEVHLIQMNLARNKAELKRVESELMEHQSKCKDRKDEIDSLSRKRDRVKTELDKLETILGEKRSFREGSPLGQSHSKAAEEYLKVLQENTHLRAELDAARNKLKTDLPQKQREVDELKRQVKAAVEDLFGEKKRSKERYEKLKEEYESSQRQLREVLRDKMTAIGKVKEEVESQKSIDLEVLKQRLVREKESEVEKLKEKSAKHLDELKRSVQMKDKELQKANVRMRERAEAATALSAELKEANKQLTEKDALVAKAEKKYLFQIEELQKMIATKEGEVKHLKTTLRQQEESARSLGQKLRDQAQEQVRKAVERQKQLQERSHEQELRKERETIMEDKQRSITEIKDNLAKEAQKAKLLQATINSLRQELEEQKQIAKQANKEKLRAIAKAKDLIRQARREEIDKLKDKLELEHRSALEKFKERVRRLEDEVRQTKENERRLQQKDRDLLAKNELTEKSLLMEINEECRRITSLVTAVSSSASQGRRSRPGTPRLGSASSQALLERPSSAPAGGQRRESVSTPKAALIQLRAACDELKRQYSELKGDLDKERQTVSQMHRDKLAELKKIKGEVMEEKAAEMTAFKEKVLKELAAGKASLQKQAAKGIEMKLQRHLKEKNDEIRELQKEIQLRREEENQRFTSKQQEENSHEVERKAKEVIRRLEIQQKAERAAHQREVERLEKEMKKVVQESSAAAAATASTTSAAPSAPATTTDAAKARAALQLARGLQMKLKQTRAENEQLKADMRKRGHVENQSQPRDNSAETQDSGLSSLACDPSPAPSELQQLQHEVKLGERRVHRASVLLSERTKEVTKLQDQIKLLNKEHLILQKQHGHALTRLGEE